MNQAIVLGIALTALSLVACDFVDSDGGRRKNVKDEDATGQATPGDPTQPGTCKEGQPHLGFANDDFVADRAVGALGADRRRVKPFSALRTELQRTLGRVPANMNQSAAAFGEASARWFSEPAAGAVSLNTTYSLAFTACYESFSAPAYGQMPTEATAQAECAKMQRSAWQRTSTPDEVKACVEFTLSLAEEPAARRRWAHSCASVLTAAGFTTY